jgi:signal transduction histidine kinase/CheY-like chemotaxis protein
MMSLIVCFSCGAILASLYINRTISEFSRLIELHQIEDLRKHLVIRIQAVQSDLYTVRTPLAHTLDSIVTNVSELDSASRGCLGCHHIPEVSDRINGLQQHIELYQNALSYYITAAANARQVEGLKNEAAAIGNKLIISTEEMSMDASSRLKTITKNALLKVNRAKTILFITVILTLAFGTAVAINMIRSFTHPVNELLHATRVIASGNLGYTISLKDKTEFGELADNFNTMSVSLKEGYTKLQEETNERKKMEQELIKSQKLESLGVLAGGIAHDFNNLLTAILGNIDIALTDLPAQSEIHDHLKNAETASFRARDLTRQLLTFSRGGAPIKKTVLITDTIKSSASFALSGSNITCEFIISDLLWPVEADDGQISQVIHNLVLNAREAMPGGGVIKIRAENVTSARMANLPLEQDRYIRITVEDMGTGIAEENLPMIFDPYFTTKKVGTQKGMGLGLAICYSIVKNHNGFITADSAVGKGTSFHVFLPASEKESPAEKEIEEGITEGEGRVLFMDDEEIVRNTGQGILKRLGYEVELCKDGTEAVEKYRAAQRSSHHFDVVIMDLTVPGNMGGREAIGKLREIDPGVRAILSSGYSNDPIMTNFREYGFCEMVVKPYKISEMGRTLRKVMAGQ